MQRSRRLLAVIAVLLTLNLGWLVRLEVQAQQTSMLLEHHRSLEQGVDRLSGIREFYRDLSSDGPLLRLHDRGLRVLSPNARSYVDLEEDRFSAWSLTPSAETIWGLSVSGSGVDLRSGDEASIEITRQRNWEIDLKTQGAITLSAETDLNDDPRILKLDENGLDVRAGGKQLLMKQDFIWLQVSEGESHKGWVFFSLQPQGANLAWSRDGDDDWDAELYLGGKGPDNDFELITKGNLVLRAGGDLTLEAPDGQVKINGKTIHLNEQPGT